MAKPKQQFIPGQEPVVNKEIEKLASEDVDVRDERMDALRIEVELKGKLVAALKEAGLAVYRRGEYDIRIESQDKVKVKVWDEEPAAEGGVVVE